MGSFAQLHMMIREIFLFSQVEMQFKGIGGNKENSRVSALASGKDASKISQSALIIRAV